MKTNNVTHTKGIDLLIQENQDYYNWRDQQFIARKYNGGLEQVTIELIPNIILEEEENGFTNGLTIMIKWIIAPTHLWKEIRQGLPHL